MKKLIPEFGNYSGEIESFPLSDFECKGFSDFFKQFRAKRWRFTGVFSPDIVMGIAVVDAGYLGTTFVYLYDRKTGKITEYNGKSPLGKASIITDNLSKGTAVFSQKQDLVKMDWDVKHKIEKAIISVKTKSDRIITDINILNNSAINEPHQVTFPTFKKKFAFTHKVAGLSASGWIKLGNKTYELNPKNSFAVIDHTIGYHDYNWKWLWSSLSGLSEDGRLIGLNLVSPITHETINENALWVDGKKHLTGEAIFEYSRKNIKNNWLIKTKNKMVNMAFKPLEIRKENINIGIIKSKFSQPIGLYNGYFILPEGEKIYIKDQIGIAEEHFARW